MAHITRDDLAVTYRPSHHGGQDIIISVRVPTCWGSPEWQQYELLSTEGMPHLGRGDSSYHLCRDGIRGAWLGTTETGVADEAIECFLAWLNEQIVNQSIGQLVDASGLVEAAEEFARSLEWGSRIGRDEALTRLVDRLVAINSEIKRQTGGTDGAREVAT